MKRLSLFIVLLSLLSVSMRAATVSGTVTNASLSAPVANQKVFILDSLSYYYDSTLTNSTGQYSFTLPSATKAGNMLLVWTSACGAYHQNPHIYAGSNVTSNFSVCGSTAPYRLHGSVSLGSKANTGLATVYLIRKAYDSTLMDTVLTLIDSTVTASIGGGYNFNFPSIPFGTLLLKAALHSSHPDYSGYLPTYDSLSLNWSGARKLTSIRFNTSVTTNIVMIAGTNPGGPGFIGGSVLVGANKMTSVGDPLSGRPLLLTDGSGQAVAYTYSDASGQFQFSNLAYGNYLLFGDAWGKTNPALAVNISASKPSVSDIFFDENNKTFKGRIGALSVGGSMLLNNLSVYPNPANDYVQIQGIEKINGAKTIVLRDVRGAVISRQSIEAGSAARISTSDLASGIYLMQVQSTEGTASFKLVK